MPELKKLAKTDIFIIKNLDKTDISSSKNVDIWDNLIYNHYINN